MNIAKIFPRSIRDAYSVWKRTRTLAPRTCPICGYAGYFENFGRPPRLDALCPSCGSVERHRLFWLWYSRHPDLVRTPILHFAAEAILRQHFEAKYGLRSPAYQTADLSAPADLQLNIEHMNLPDGSISSVVCNHVLEHVDDRKALCEIRRILRDEGIAILSVPIVEGWAHTYENVDIVDPKARELHFGQSDHVRYYGYDFRDRLREAGFDFDEIMPTPEEVASYSLLRGEKLFICRKINHVMRSTQP